MPNYPYECGCGHRFIEFRPMSESHLDHVCPSCRAVAKRAISRPYVRGDFEGYQCPVTERWVEGRAAHEENLKRTGCRILEPGEKERADSARRREQESFENKIAETAERYFEALPSEKKEKIGAELTAGLDVSYERSTPNLGV